MLFMPCSIWTCSLLGCSLLFVVGLVPIPVKLLSRSMHDKHRRATALPARLQAELSPAQLCRVLYIHLALAGTCLD